MIGKLLPIDGAKLLIRLRASVPARVAEPLTASTS